MFELERELPGRMIIPYGTTKKRKGEIHVVPAVATPATGTLASLGFVLGQLLLRQHMLFAPSGFADREADRLAVADEDGRLSPRTGLIPSASAAAAMRLRAVSSRSIEAGATSALISPAPSTETKRSEEHT